MEPHSIELSEPKDEDEIKKISMANPNSFLHIFDYTQNNEVKSYSTIEKTQDKVSLCLRAPDAETYSRLNHEIDQIDRMNQDLKENRKRFFEDREEEDLFLYDSMLKLEDINGTADTKINTVIKKSDNYNSGKRLGQKLKNETSKPDPRGAGDHPAMPFSLDKHKPLDVREKIEEESDKMSDDDEDDSQDNSDEDYSDENDQDDEDDLDLSKNLHEPMHGVMRPESTGSDKEEEVEFRRDSKSHEEQMPAISLPLPGAFKRRNSAMPPTEEDRKSASNFSDLPAPSPSSLLPPPS